MLIFFFPDSHSNVDPFIPTIENFKDRDPRYRLYFMMIQSFSLSVHRRIVFTWSWIQFCYKDVKRFHTIVRCWSNLDATLNRNSGTLIFKRRRLAGATTICSTSLKQTQKRSVRFSAEWPHPIVHLQSKKKVYFFTTVFTRFPSHSQGNYIHLGHWLWHFHVLWRCLCLKTRRSRWGLSFERYKRGPFSLRFFLIFQEPGFGQVTPREPGIR